MSTVILKARAKRLRTAVAAMFKIHVSTAQSLELVAKEENFPNWDAASANYEHPDPKQPIPHARQTSTASDFLTKHSQHGMFIIAPSGSGKHLHVLHTLLDRVRLGKTVVVLDRGRSYYKVAEVLGGTYYCLRPDEEHEISRFGDTPFVVYDFDQMPTTGQAIWQADLPGLPPRLQTGDGFLVIDEAWAVSTFWPKVVPFLMAVTQGGGSFCVIGQRAEDVRNFVGCSVPVIQTLRLEAKPPLPE